ncbi:1625_t:CDS:2, partial [Gigaspora margarita]
TSPSVQSIELNSQDNNDPIDLNVQTFELSDKDINGLMNPNFQTRAPLSDLQINTTTQTHPSIYGLGNSQTRHGIY